jgi:hypothetical protein
MDGNQAEPNAVATVNPIQGGFSRERVIKEIGIRESELRPVKNIDEPERR